MNRCIICGEPCGIYDICRQCQKDIQDGKVIQCQFCGKYHLAGKKCSCQEEPKTENIHQQQEQININVEDQTEEPSTFSKTFGGTMGIGCGCFVVIGIILFIIIISGGAIINALF